ncbi:MAG: hypothetical protein IJ074_10460 [Clostridia bacterium]|nr:hypothetical protein [Clostridia bacterium]
MGADPREMQEDQWVLEIQINPPDFAEKIDAWSQPLALRETDQFFQRL